MPRKTVTIRTRDGECPTSVFTPNDGSGPWPAVLIFMDGRGVRPALFELGERLASAGYYVLLPDLFYRAGPYTAPDAKSFSDPEVRNRWITKFFSTASHANIRSDTSAFLDFLSEQSDVHGKAVGTTGYCMGGGLSLDAAANFPDRVVAAASYHGGHLATDAADSPHLLAQNIKARVYVAGAIEDPFFDDAQKERLIAALKQADVDFVVETYEGARHGWVPTDSSVYQAEGAEKHWRTLVALFDDTLKSAAR